MAPHEDGQSQSSAERKANTEPQTKLHYLGPPGTYSHQAALLIAKRIIRGGNASSGGSKDYIKADLRPAPTIAATFQAAWEDDKAGGGGAAEAGVTKSSLALLPFENSTYGPVTDTYDILAAPSSSQQHCVLGDVLLPVSHCLMVSRATHAALQSSRRRQASSSSQGPQPADGADESWDLEDLSQIRKVYSHRQALGQCRRFLDAHLPQANRVAVESTGDGAVQVREGGLKGEATFEACIASELCASDDIYGLSIAQRAIQDRSDNTTRFLLVQATAQTERDTSDTLTVLPPPSASGAKIPASAIASSNEIKSTGENKTRRSGRAILRIETSLAMSEGGTLQKILAAGRPTQGTEQGSENGAVTTKVWPRKVDRVVPKVEQDENGDAGCDIEQGSSWPCVYLVEIEAHNVFQKGSAQTSDGGQIHDGAYDSQDQWESIAHALKEVAGRGPSSSGEKVKLLGMWQSS